MISVPIFITETIKNDLKTTTLCQQSQQNMYIPQTVTNIYTYQQKFEKLVSSVTSFTTSCALHLIEIPVVSTELEHLARLQLLHHLTAHFHLLASLAVPPLVSQSGGLTVTGLAANISSFPIFLLVLLKIR